MSSLLKSLQVHFAICSNVVTLLMKLWSGGSLCPLCSFTFLLLRMISKVAKKRMGEMEHPMSISTSSCCYPVVNSWRLKLIWTSQKQLDIRALIVLGMWKNSCTHLMSLWWTDPHVLVRSSHTTSRLFFFLLSPMDLLPSHWGILHSFLFLCLQIRSALCMQANSCLTSLDSVLRLSCSSSGDFPPLSASWRWVCTRVVVSWQLRQIGSSVVLSPAVGPTCLTCCSSASLSLTFLTTLGFPLVNSQPTESGHLAAQLECSCLVVDVIYNI